MHCCLFTDVEKERIRKKCKIAEKVLFSNISAFEQFGGKRLLKPGKDYPGIWLEHNQDNLFLADYDPEAAWNSQDAFMTFQREDGLFPFVLPYRPGDPNHFFSADACFGQIQCVWNFTRCAMEIAQKCHRPASDYRRIYEAGKRYDAWLKRYRDRSQSGLVEMYCEYDTGHDNSPRVTCDGIPHSCPGNDSVNMPDLPVMPILSADLSAMAYGNKTALADLASRLGEKEGAAFYRKDAAGFREKIFQLLYAPEDDFFYDRDPRGFRKYRTEHITRFFLNGVITQKEFDRIWEKHFAIPGKGFSPAYPIPSVAVDDPHFIREKVFNCWGRNTQALTTLRAILWMKRYHRDKELDVLLEKWLRTVCLEYDNPFTQELDPFTGEPNRGGNGGYTPTTLIVLEAAKRFGLR